MEQGTFGEYMAGTQSDLLYGTYMVSPMQGRLIVDLEPTIYTVLLNGLTGGKYDVILTNHNLTDLDISLMRTVYENMSSMFKRAWERTFCIEMMLESLEVSPQYIYHIDPHECVIIVCICASTNTSSGKIKFCLPYHMLHSTMERLIVQNIRMQENTQRDNSMQLQALLSPTPLDVTVLQNLGSFSIGYITTLQTGDVIKCVNSAYMCFADIPKFEVTLGRLAANVAVLLGESYKEGGDDLQMMNPYMLPSLDGKSVNSTQISPEMLHDIPLEVSVRLGATKLSVKDVMALTKGSVVKLDTLAGEEVDILVNGRVIGKGEVVVIDDTLGVRITNIG